jgi:glycosyltransferase involved in cell wall biosynthesis
VALIEAMAAGKAVVATAVGGVPDLIASEETGLLVPAGDSQALGEAIGRLAADPARRRQLGLAGRAFVSERYSVSRLVEDIERLYRSALMEKRGA